MDRVKGVLSEFRRLLHPHYIVNICLVLLFFAVRSIYPFCSWFFPQTPCELDWREWEITMFVVIVVVFKTRKSGSTTMVAYLSSAFMYLKIGNVILFMSADPRLGIAYCVLCVVQLLLLPEPTYAGPENIVYFRGQNLIDELNRDRRVTWVIAFFAAWSPACVTFAPIFAELSAKYSLPNLKFGKLDVTRYPEVAKTFYVNDSAFSKQLPTISIMKNGKEVTRRPLVDDKGRLEKFFFTLDNIKAGLDLNNVYLECKKNPLVKEKKSKQNLNDKSVAEPVATANGHPKSE